MTEVWGGVHVAMPPGQALRWATLSLGLATLSPACALGSTPKGMSAGEMTGGSAILTLADGYLNTVITEDWLFGEKLKCFWRL